MNPPPPVAAPRAALVSLLAPLLVWLALLVASHTLHDHGGADTAYRIASSAAWLSGAWLLLGIVNNLFWDRWVPRRGGVRVPRLLRQVVALVVMALALGVLLNQVWQVSVVPVVAATGAVGIVIGLALRNVLADFFSGIALNMEHPFGLDDFVLLHVRGKREPVAGMVRELNWRSTTILTPEANLISVPNSAVARATVENLSLPSPQREQDLEIVLDWALDQAAVQAVMRAAAIEAWVNGATCGSRPADCQMRRLDGAGVTYKIIYLFDPSRKAPGKVRHALLSCLHRHLRFAGLRPVPAADTQPGAVSAPQRLVDHTATPDRLLALQQIPLLQTLTADERLTLATALQVRHAATDDTVVRAGDAGASMFIVVAGVLDVLVASPGGGQDIRRNTMAPGGFFGEMSLLTGAPRRATVRALCDCVLYELPRDTLAHLLAARPALADGLAKVVAEHQRRDAAAVATADDGGLQRSIRLHEQIAARIRTFFGG